MDRIEKLTAFSSQSWCLEDNWTLFKGNKYLVSPFPHFITQCNRGKQLQDGQTLFWKSVRITLLTGATVLLLQSILQKDLLSFYLEYQSQHGSTAALLQSFYTPAHPLAPIELLYSSASTALLASSFFVKTIRRVVYPMYIDFQGSKERQDSLDSISSSDSSDLSESLPTLSWSHAEEEKKEVVEIDAASKEAKSQEALSTTQADEEPRRESSATNHTASTGESDFVTANQGSSDGPEEIRAHNARESVGSIFSTMSDISESPSTEIENTLLYYLESKFHYKESSIVPEKELGRYLVKHKTGQFWLKIYNFSQLLAEEEKVVQYGITVFGEDNGHSFVEKEKRGIFNLSDADQIPKRLSTVPGIAARDPVDYASEYELEDKHWRRITQFASQHCNPVKMQEQRRRSLSHPGRVHRPPRALPQAISPVKKSEELPKSESKEGDAKRSSSAPPRTPTRKGGIVRAGPISRSQSAKKQPHYMKQTESFQNQKFKN